MINLKEMEKVCDIFMKDDIKGLKALYDLTNDELCNVVIGWLERYDERINESGLTNEWEMYDDIISYLWKKYDIGGNEI